MPCSLLEASVRQPHKTLLLWVVLIVAFLAIWQFLNDQDPGGQRAELPYSEFMTLVKAPATSGTSTKSKSATGTTASPS